MQQQLMPCKPVTHRMTAAVHQISQRLKCVIRQPQRHQDIDNFALSRVLADKRAEKVEIFEETQYCQSSRYAEAQPEFPYVFVFRRHQQTEQMHAGRIAGNYGGKDRIQVIQPAHPRQQKQNILHRRHTDKCPINRQKSNKKYREFNRQQRHKCSLKFLLFKCPEYRFGKSKRTIYFK